MREGKPELAARGSFARAGRRAKALRHPASRLTSLIKSKRRERCAHSTRLDKIAQITVTGRKQAFPAPSFQLAPKSFPCHPPNVASPLDLIQHPLQQPALPNILSLGTLKHLLLLIAHLAVLGDPRQLPRRRPMRSAFGKRPPVLKRLLKWKKRPHKPGMLFEYGPDGLG